MASISKISPAAFELNTVVAIESQRSAASLDVRSVFCLLLDFMLLYFQMDFSSCALSVVRGTGPPMASTLMLLDVGVIIFGE